MYELPDRFSFSDAEDHLGHLGLDYGDLVPRPPPSAPPEVDEDGVYVTSASALTPAQSYLTGTSGVYHALDDDGFLQEFERLDGYQELTQVRGLREGELAGIKVDLAHGCLVNGTAYVFDHPGEGKVEVRLTGQECPQLATYSQDRELCFVLDPDLYGFDTGEMLSYRQRKDVRREWSAVRVEGSTLQLNRSSDEALDGLYAAGEMPIAEFLETVGGIVNGSMEYDKELLYDALEKIARRESIPDDVLQHELAELRTQDTADPDATMTGVCRHAGLLVRDILLSLEMDDRYLWAQTTGLIEEGVPGHHDYTLFVDRETGHWAIINSKTTRNGMNLVPRERLEECGAPFTGM